jgi:hypothetical protein
MQSTPADLKEPAVLEDTSLFRWVPLPASVGGPVVNDMIITFGSFHQLSAKDVADFLKNQCYKNFCNLSQKRLFFNTYSGQCFDTFTRPYLDHYLCYKGKNK